MLNLRCWMIIGLLGLLLATAAAQGEATLRPSWEQQLPTWQTHTDYEGRFRVHTPGAFVSRTDTMRVPVGKIVYHVYYFQTPVDTADNVVYLVSYCDYPDGTLSSDSSDLLNDFFEATIQGATEAVRGELMFATEAWLGEHPGRYWRIDYLNGRASARTKAYVVGQRYYAVQTMSRNELGINPSTDRFFDSFRLLGTGNTTSSTH